MKPGKVTLADNWSITCLHILYSGFISWEKKLFLWQFVKVPSVKINPDLILDTDILGYPTWLHAYLTSTVLIMGSFQCADSKLVGLHQWQYLF